jgi:hypothetical protein
MKTLRICAGCFLFVSLYGALIHATAMSDAGLHILTARMDNRFLQGLVRIGWLGVDLLVVAVFFSIGAWIVSVTDKIALMVGPRIMSLLMVTGCVALWWITDSFLAWPWS